MSNLNMNMKAMEVTPEIQRKLERQLNQIAIMKKLLVEMKADGVNVTEFEKQILQAEDILTKTINAFGIKKINDVITKQ